MAKPVFRIGSMKSKLPRIVFTREELALLNRVVAVSEEIIRVQKTRIPNAIFALETITRLQAKISRIIAQRRWNEEVALDANELLILQAALSIFTSGLETMKLLPEEEEVKQQCQLLALLLADYSRPQHLND